MDNKELKSKFYELTIDNDNNIFNIICSLKPLDKEYKTTPFYKATRMPIKKAYRIYQESEGIVFSLLNAITNLDFSKMDFSSFISSFGDIKEMIKVLGVEQIDFLSNLANDVDSKL